MMSTIEFIDRATGKKEQELVYGGAFIRFLYGDTLLSRLIGKPIADLIARMPWISAFYGYLQSRAASAKKIVPFIEKYGVDASEFAMPVSSYQSFNDFFTRKLKPSARPIDSDPETAIIPADGRYLFYQRIDEVDGFVVKGKKFDLATFLGDAELAKEYAKGSMAIARLCPSDYHRYHLPCDCIPGESTLINGWLYSVNPIAIQKNIAIFAENKRTLCILDSERFGKVLFLEIGATFVGAIHETYTLGRLHTKGDEKGYFSFGGSSLILLFPPNSIQFDKDLLAASANHVEIKCLMGSSMGTLVTIHEVNGPL